MRNMKAIANLGNIRSMNTVGARSIPKAQRSIYLDLYVIKKEKDRLEGEMFVLDKKRKIVSQLLADIEKRLHKLQEEMKDVRETKKEKQARRDGIRTMPIKY